MTAAVDVEPAERVQSSGVGGTVLHTEDGAVYVEWDIPEEAR